MNKEEIVKFLKLKWKNKITVKQLKILRHMKIKIMIN